MAAEPSTRRRRNFARHLDDRGCVVSGFVRLRVALVMALTTLPWAARGQTEERWVGALGLRLCQPTSLGPRTCERLAPGTKVLFTGATRRDAAGRTQYEVTTEDGDTKGWVSASERDRSLEQEDPYDREERARAACTPNQPRVGMTEQEVLSTCWGKPRYRRRVGVEGLMRDQWVYGDGRYLYFDNGQLLAIEE